MNKAQPEESTPIRILRKREVVARTGLCQSTIDNRIGAGDFPTAINLGGRAVGWIESEVQGWIQKKIEASRGTEQGADEKRS